MTGFLIIEHRRTIAEHNWPLPPNTETFRANFVHGRTPEGALHEDLISPGCSFSQVRATCSAQWVRRIVDCSSCQAASRKPLSSASARQRSIATSTKSSDKSDARTLTLRCAINLSPQLHPNLLPQSAAHG